MREARATDHHTMPSSQPSRGTAYLERGVRGNEITEDALDEDSLAVKDVHVRVGDLAVHEKRHTDLGRGHVGLVRGAGKGGAEM
jgi:hypothetical protein